MAESISLSTYNFSVEDYHKMIDEEILKEWESVELIEGKIVVIDYDKTLLHTATIYRLKDVLRTIFKSKIIICDQKSITLGSYSEPEPDIAVVKFREDYYEEAHPKAADVLLAIEVSLTTQKYDRETVPLYASYGIPETWMVDLKKKIIEIYQRPVGDNYTIKATYEITDKLTSNVVKTIAVNRIIKK